MHPLLARLCASLLFLGAWCAATVAVYWLVSTLYLESRELSPDRVPPSFTVAVQEPAVDGLPPSYRMQRYQDLRASPLAAGESLHLGVPAFEFPGSCCFSFKVLADDANGQLVELDADDMSYVRSRYYVRNGTVVPVSHRQDYALYYPGYLLLGGLIAWLATRPARRRLRARPAPAGASALS